MGLQVESDPSYKIPTDGVAIFSEYMAPLFTDTEQRKGLFRTISPDSVRVMTPHKIYVAGLADAEGPDVLDAATPVGWRYLLFSGKKKTPFAAAEIAMDLENKNARFSRIVKSPRVPATAVELQEEKIGPKVADDDYELRFLRIRDLSFFGLWLHCYANKDDDFVIPLPPVPRNMAASEKISRADLIPRLKAIAVEVRKRFLRRP
ncbi:MAG TPA: hypothetical protein VOA87_09885 [Thermoanaerobaculia bacterium]|nr:hypothetical protein [Thermoanaerobaculia bacterium]